MSGPTKTPFAKASIVICIVAAVFWYALARFRGVPLNLGLGALVITIILISAISTTVLHMKDIRSNSNETGSSKHSSLLRLWYWRHAGEEGAVRVFSNTVDRLLIVIIAALTASWFVFPRLRAHPLILGVIGLVIALRTIADGRRAMIFTSDDLIYRPPFGELIRIPVKEIVNIEDTTVVRGFALRARVVNGIVLTLSNGERRTLPLDFEGGPSAIKEQVSGQMKAR